MGAKMGVASGVGAPTFQPPDGLIGFGEPVLDEVGLVLVGRDQFGGEVGHGRGGPAGVEQEVGGGKQLGFAGSGHGTSLPDVVGCCLSLR